MKGKIPLPDLPKRNDEDHKGRFGTALIVGGSLGMSGAAGLAGMAALRGGAGLVRVAVPDVCLNTVASFNPSYMTLPLPADQAGHISIDAWDSLVEQSNAATAIACGPGLGKTNELEELVVRLYQKVKKPMVFDADALNALAMQPDALSRPGGPRILTPHPGEFARLIGNKLPKNQRDNAAIQLASQCGVVIALKGHNTLVTDGTQHVKNNTGNPGMATGGTGDVLTGLITALLCQKLEPYDASRLGVYLHGLAGDLAAEQTGQVSIIASDLISFLANAIKTTFK